MKLLQFYKKEAVAGAAVQAGCNTESAGCAAGQKPRLGILTDKGIIDVQEAAAELGITAPGSVKEAAELWGKESGKAKAEAANAECPGSCAVSALEEIAAKCGKYIAEDDISYAPAVTEPEKIFCVGLNYRKHAEETNIPIPQYPVLFNKFPSSLAAHNGEVFLPRAYKEYDYEAELVLVIGKTAKNVSREEAADCIFGCTCGDDLSNRFLQNNRGGQWMIGKIADGFAPVGPVVNTELKGSGLEIKGYLNGELRQHSNTSDLIFDPATIVSYISETVTLKPGDLIFTGTPSGVILGYPEGEQKWLAPGDVYEVEIEGIGRLRNKFV